MNFVGSGGEVGGNSYFINFLGVWEDFMFYSKLRYLFGI